MLMAVAVTESSASRPLKLKFIFEGDEVESNNNIKMQSGWFESLRGPVTPTGPSNCQNPKFFTNLKKTYKKHNCMLTQSLNTV